MSAPRASVPWHRVPFVWLLIALPFAAVAGGFTTLWLALRSDDGLVVDDYYRRGVEINRTLDRDRAAAARGIMAEIRIDNEGREARIALTLAPAKPPARLQVQLLHATRKGHDRRVTAAPDTAGDYRVPLAGLVPGHYYVELAAGDWRLVGSLRIPDDTELRLVPVAGLPER
jgi:hypothetical protein